MTLHEQLQCLHAAITGGAPLESAQRLVIGDGIDALSRLRVYRHAYTARVADVLEHDYPKLALATDLRAVVPDYLRAHPPSHPSLREVGAPIASFLASKGAAPHLVDIAMLERARVEVFDSADGAPLSREHLAERDPAEFPALHLQLVPSSRIVVLATNADDIWDAIEDERELPAPSLATRTVLVWRREYTVIHRTLEPDEARVAQSLAAATTFGELCDELDGPPERAIELLVRWLDAQCLRR